MTFAAVDGDDIRATFKDHYRYVHGPVWLAVSSIIVPALGCVYLQISSGNINVTVAAVAFGAVILAVAGAVSYTGIQPWDVDWWCTSRYMPARIAIWHLRHARWTKLYGLTYLHLSSPHTGAPVLAAAYHRSVETHLIQIRLLFLDHPRTPTDVLVRIAATETNRVAVAAILAHDRIPDAVKVVTALRIPADEHIPRRWRAAR